MNLSVKLRNDNLPSDLRKTIERRAFFALGRFGERIVGTEVILADTNGPRGGVDQRCIVRVRMPAASSVVIEANDVDALAAVDRALDRAARRVRDRLNRRRVLQRIRWPHFQFAS